MLSKKRQRSLAQKAGQRLRGASACLISDYGFGAATPELAAKLRSPIVTLDSRYSLQDYRKAGITAATPNEAELESLFHTRIGNDIQRLDALGKKALTQFGFAALLVTRGKDGMALFERGNPSRHIPIHGSDETVDVTGAGDTVIAVFTLALAAGATYLEAAHIANYAGGIVVMKRRTATVTRAELEAALRAEITAAGSESGMNTREKILSREALVAELAALRRNKGGRSFSPMDASIFCTLGTCGILPRRGKRAICWW